MLFIIKKAIKSPGKLLTILYCLIYEFFILKKLLGFDWPYSEAMLLLLTPPLFFLVREWVLSDRAEGAALLILDRAVFMYRFNVSEVEMDVFEFYWGYWWGEIDYYKMCDKFSELNTTVEEMNLYFSNQILKQWKN